jgi:hypothetical protein
MLDQVHVAACDIGEPIGRLLSAESVYTPPATLQVGAEANATFLNAGATDASQRCVQPAISLCR